ncbi:MAG TPA: hypothetical protein VMG10_33825 [Gemmataceae bacterium]|nr:hypothetical protein [Gemmataceae bacterium]
MSRIWDCLNPIRDLISWLDGPRRTTPERRTVGLQLEQLEKRDVPSAAASVQPPNLDQLYQQILQAEASPVANAVYLKGTLTTATAVLPPFSAVLNGLSQNLSAAVGPQVGQQYMQMGIQQVDSFLLNLENATFSALSAVGDAQDPTFLSDVTDINTFMSEPLSYTPPV